MKKIAVFLVMLCMALSINARTFVVCVGVSNYQNSANNLAQTTKDAKAFKSVMENHTKDITILTSRYANKTNILEKLRAVCNRAQKGDHVLFFFSGHGYPGGFAAYDAALSYDKVRKAMAKNKCRNKMIFADACYSGKIRY